MVVRCKGAASTLNGRYAELVARSGEGRLVSRPVVRWRCSRCGSPDCLPDAVEGRPAVTPRQYGNGRPASGMGKGVDRQI